MNINESILVEISNIAYVLKQTIFVNWQDCLITDVCKLSIENFAILLVNMKDLNELNTIASIVQTFRRPGLRVKELTGVKALVMGMRNHP